MLFSLPCDVIKVILQSISLWDISRLLMATNNHCDYLVLLEAVQDLEYPVFFQDDIGVYRTTNQFFRWARKIKIRLSLVDLSSRTKSLVNYLEEMGTFVTDVKFQSYSVVLPIAHLIPNITHCRSFHVNAAELLSCFPRLESITAYDPTLNMNGMTAEQWRRVRSLYVNGQRAIMPFLSQLPMLKSFKLHDEGMEYEDSDGLSVADAEYFASSCPHLEYITTAWSNYGGLQRLLSLFPTLTQLHLLCGPERQLEWSYDKTLVVVNLLHLTMENLVCHSSLFDYIGDCCPNLITLDIIITSDHYKQPQRDPFKRLLSNCRQIKKLSYCESVETGPTSDILYDVLMTGHPTLRELKISQSSRSFTSSRESIPLSDSAHGTLLPCLKSLEICTAMRPVIIHLLRRCPRLVAIAYLACNPRYLSKDANEMLFDVKLLYETCPQLQWFLYHGAHWYRAFQHSHPNLEALLVRDSGTDNQKISLTKHQISFPSLRVLEVYSEIDPIVWTNLMLHSSFHVHRFSVGWSTISQKEHLLDAVLHHSNFRDVQMVLCNETMAQYEKLTQMSGGRIQFHGYRWLDSEDTRPNRVMFDRYV